MSNKPNEEVIIQNVAGFISKTTSNISFKPNLRLADRNMFAHLATGKICIRIYDFKDGKGDQAVEVTARVDIETLPYLYECARSFTMREPFFEAKIFGEPVRGGQFNGLCQMTRLQIARQHLGRVGALQCNLFKRKAQLKPLGNRHIKRLCKKNPEQNRRVHGREELLQGREERILFHDRQGFSILYKKLYGLCFCIQAAGCRQWVSH